MAKRMDQIGGSVVAKGTKANPMAQVLRTIIETQDPAKYALPKPPTRFPTSQKQGLSANKAYYDNLGAPLGDDWAASVRLRALQELHRAGAKMSPTDLEMVEQNAEPRQKMGTLPSRLPEAVAAREQVRLGNAKGSKGIPSNTVPGLEPGATSERPPGFGVQSTPEKQVQQQIDAPAWAFKGGKAPLQEDVDMVVNAQGTADEKAAVQAFAAKFGPQAVEQYLMATE